MAGFNLIYSFKKELYNSEYDENISGKILLNYVLSSDTL